MEGIFKGSPYRRHTDEEAGGGSRRGFDSDEDEDPFSIARTKNAPVDRLRRWRQAALVLNASRRFRYTLDLKKEEEKQQTLRKIRAHAQAIRAAVLFKGVVTQVNGPEKLTAVPGDDFAIGPEQLSSMTRDHNNNALQHFGGVKGLSDMLETNLDKGILGDDADLLKRRNVFGSNIYPQKKGRSFWMFLWEAWQDLTLIILMIAAAASLALGIKTEGIEEGWYDGGSIAFAVILVIVVTARIRKFRVSASISEDSGEETPLQVRLNGVATFIGIVGLTVALIVLVVLLARFKRMFHSPQTAENLIWHANKRIEDGNLRHPTDSPAWKLIDNKWPEFSQDPRNLRLALSSDGVNPYSNQSITYSCWPVKKDLNTFQNC